MYGELQPEPCGRVVLRPFVRQPDGLETVIGLPARGVFLAISNEALEVLDWLAAGDTVAAAQARYREKYGDSVDLQEFLIDLEERGFLKVLPADQEAVAPPTSGSLGNVEAGSHFGWISQRFASRVFNRSALAIYLSVIAAGVGAAIGHPDLLPGWEILAFHEKILPIACALLAIDLLGTFVHEMAHLVAARAHGIGAKLGIGNRLWILVAETDLTGIWQLPPRDRYLPLLAGPLVDALTASLLVLVLYILAATAVHSAAAVHAIQSVLLIYILKLVWQFFFFLRTDYYYVLANFFRCKNLMGDTEVFLNNQFKRLLGRHDTLDQSHIPALERRAFLLYSVIWVAGRLAALYIFIAISLRLAFHYVILIVDRLREGGGASPYNFFESIVISAISVLLFAAGCWLWVRSVLSRR